MSFAELPLILAMDTATRCSSVALTRGTPVEGEVLACLSLNSSITHSRRLISLVDELFRQTETGWPDISAVGVGLGPGSFTGLRIGMATAKGFAAAAGKHLVGVSTLDALAAMCCVTDKSIHAVMDARKKQVYTAEYSVDDSGLPCPKGDIKVVSPEYFAARITEPVVMVGDGILAYGDVWRKMLGAKVSFVPAQLLAPSAAALGLLCGNQFKEQNFLDLDAAAPVYVRASDAELSLADKKKKAQA